MDEMTECKVRSLAGQKLGIDLSTSQLKKFVRQIVESFLTSTKQPEPDREVEEEESVEEEAKAKVVDEEEEEEIEEKEKGGGSGKEYDDDGDLIMCRLSNKRRVTIQEFKGKTLGKQLPSSKGISLTAEQWSAFRKAVPAIEESIKKLESR